jgi:hypothetical protein
LNGGLRAGVQLKIEFPLEQVENRDDQANGYHSHDHRLAAESAFGDGGLGLDLFSGGPGIVGPLAHDGDVEGVLGSASGDEVGVGLAKGPAGASAIGKPEWSMTGASAYGAKIDPLSRNLPPYVARLMYDLPPLTNSMNI